MKKLIGFPSRLAGIIFLSAIFMILNNCSKQDDYGTAPIIPTHDYVYVVSIQGGQFFPSEISVSVDDTVRWKNSDGYGFYRIVCDSAHFAGELRPGDTYFHVFSKTGTFGYTCNNQPGMKGYVIVH